MKNSTRLLVIVASSFILVGSTYGHGGRLNSSSCHNDNVGGTVYHCHPGGDYNTTTYPNSSSSSSSSSSSGGSSSDDREWEVATKQELLDEIREHKSCNTFTASKWGENDYERCKDLLDEGDVYTLNEIKEDLILRKSCSSFSKFEHNYSECREIITDGVYTREEIKKLSHNYRDCGKIDSYFSTDKKVCNQSKQENTIEENTTISKKEEVLDKYKVRLDKINVQLGKIYKTNPQKIEKLLSQIKAIKSKLEPEDKNYIILEYIQDYIEGLKVPNLLDLSY